MKSNKYCNECNSKKELCDIKLWCFLTLGLTLLTFACKQSNSNERQELDPTNKVTITVQGDRGVTITNPNNFTVNKGAKWANVEPKATTIARAITNFKIKEWRIKEINGTLITKANSFNEDTVIFAVSEEHKDPEQPTISITIKADSGYKFKDTKTPCTIEVSKGETWISVKPRAKEKLELLKEYKEASWKLEDENGKNLDDSFVFNKNEIIFAMSKKEMQGKVKITIKGDERVEVLEPKYVEASIDSPKTFADIKTEINKMVKLESSWSVEDYCFYDWRIGEEEGEEIIESTQITEDIVVYARTNYKNFRLVETELEGYYGKDPRGRIFIPKETTKVKTDAFEECEGLTAVDFSPCSNLKEIEGKYSSSPFSNCSNLKKVSLRGCNELIGINLSRTGITNIDLSQCKKVQKINFNDCKNLKTLNLTDCAELNSIDSSSTDIRSIDLSSCKKLEKVNFKDCKNLKIINLTNCAELNSINSSTTNIGSIDLSPCQKIKNIDFYNCKNLKIVNLTGCDELNSINLSNTDIASLDLSSCKKLEKISLNDCKNLKIINLTGCAELTNISSSNTDITSIDLSSCKKVKDINFYNCKNLRTINLIGCAELTKINLHNTDITSVDLSLCTKLTSINLSGTNIKGIDLFSCTKLTRVLFNNCKNLLILDLTKCNNLKKLGGIQASDGNKQPSFSGSLKAEIKLPSSVSDVPKGVFGTDESTWCNKVLVPNGTIKNLVKKTGYPENRIAIY